MVNLARSSSRRTPATRRFRRARELLDWVDILSPVAALIPVSVFLGFPWIAAGGGAGVTLLVLLTIKLVRPRHRFGLLERRDLIAYHRAEVKRMATQLPVDGVVPAEKHEERLRAGYGFVSPSFTGSGAFGEAESIIDVLSEGLRTNQKLLLLGDPGSGKSLIASIVFARLSDAFAAAPRKAPCPVFLQLNAMRPDKPPMDMTVSRAEEQAGWLKEQLAPDVVLPDARRLARLVDNDRVILICDGLDEAPVMRSPQRLSSIIPENLIGLFRMPTLLTSRTAFFSIYMDASEVMADFESVGRLLPLRFEEHGTHFIRWYAAARGRPDLAGDLVKIIDGNASLKEAVARPLVLRMTAEVLLDLVLDDHAADSLLTVGHGGETSTIYSRYVDKWLQREQSKEPSRLKWWQKRELIQCVAWETFAKSLASGRGWGHFELKDLLIEGAELREITRRWSLSNILVDGSIDDMCREVATRSFLIVSTDRRRYRFVHKSLFEFCVARHVVDSLDERRVELRPERADLLLHPLPDEVIDFLRELLVAVAADPERRPATEATFLAILGSVGDTDDPGQLMAAQQALNLLPIVAGADTMRRLRSGDLCGDHPFLRRAVAVADALHYDRHELLNAFVKHMEKDREAESFHMGYNRIYYGDQAFGDGQWVDDGHPECGRFFRATIRHLKTQAYRRIRVMDFYSLRAMLRNPDRCRYLICREDQALRELGALVEISDPELGHEFERQRLLLRAELKAVLGDESR